MRSLLFRYAAALVLGYAWSAFVPARGLGTEPEKPESGLRHDIEGIQRAAHRHPDRSPSYFAELERGFLELQRRYPAEAEIYAELLFVADHREGADGASLARRILDWPAPTSVKEKALGVLKKKAALGHPFDLSLTTTDGSELRLSDWRGKVVLVDFWASWCPPCRETLPELRQLHARLRSRGLEIVGISFDDDLDKLRRCLEAERIPWKQSADGKGWTDSSRARDLGLTSLPGLWLLDRQGVLRDVDARDGLEAKLERLLAAP